MSWRPLCLIGALLSFGAIDGLHARSVSLAVTTSAPDVPRFDVDPFWPKPLPHNWVLGQAPSVFVDAQDHVWLVTRPRTLTRNDVGASLTPPTSECCVPAPPVIEFDAVGNVLQAWGGPGEGYEWPDTEHGIAVDGKGNVWIGGSGARDRQILKFTNDGKFLLQIGHQLPAAEKAAARSADIENLAEPANIFVDAKADEVYVADGYVNRRVIVFDAESGRFKRQWGAYGNKPEDAAPRTRDPNAPPSQQFNILHSIKLSNDRTVYAVDRYNNRIQLFTPEGKFLREVFISRQTTDSRGTASDVAFSPDKNQRFLYVADAANYKVRILDRSTLEQLASFGRQGYYAGQWHWLHGLATDSKGNLYTSESQGNRVQKFIAKF